MSYLIEHEKFSSGKSLVELFQPTKEIPMPKLNVKIRKSDLRIVDDISRQSGNSRSYIINAMIGSILTKLLKDLAVANQDCAALVAKRADLISGIGYTSEESWSYLVFGDTNQADYYHGCEFPQRPFDSFTDQFKLIQERLDKAKP